MGAREIPVLAYPVSPAAWFEESVLIWAVYNTGCGSVLT